MRRILDTIDEQLAAGSGADGPALARIVTTTSEPSNAGRNTENDLPGVPHLWYYIGRVEMRTLSNLAQFQGQLD
jgi:hypothetical protein